MKDYVFAYNSDKGALPWFTSLGIYWILSLVGLGWLIRFIISSNSRRIVFEFKKLILN